MHPSAFPLLHEIHQRTDGASATSPDLRRAVALLVTAADPARAERLVPREGEAPALVARLAVWAVRRVDAHAIAAALAVLTEEPTVDAPAMLPPAVAPIATNHELAHAC